MVNYYDSKEEYLSRTEQQYVKTHEKVEHVGMIPNPYVGRSKASWRG